MLFILGGSGLLGPIAAVVLIITAVTYFSNKSNEQPLRSAGLHSQRPFQSRYEKKLTPSEKAKINVYLRKYFAGHRSLLISNQISLVVHSGRYNSLSDLDVYENGEYHCTFDAFGKKYPQSYDSILIELVHLSEQPLESDVFEAEVKEHKEEVKKEEVKPEEKAKDAQYFINEINRLNTSIPDEAVSNGLYETCALLKQIQSLEKKFPESKDKLEKLYEYYLPILVRILVQFDNLQNATSDPSYKSTHEKLTKTIGLINDAMKTIITSMTDRDFINLSADISTLEAVLQKDGFAGDNRMGLYPNSDDKEG